MINFENLGFLAIVVMLLIIGLIGYIAFNIFVKKKRPKNYYTPYDYIIGQTDKEFHNDQLEEKEPKDDKEDDELK